MLFDLADDRPWSVSALGPRLGANRSAWLVFTTPLTSHSLHDLWRQHGLSVLGHLRQLWCVDALILIITDTGFVGLTTRPTLPVTTTVLFVDDPVVILSVPGN